MILAKIKSFSKGEQIIKEGDTEHTAFLINKGHVEIKKTMLNGHTAELTTLGPGQMFGEMCLFDNKPRSASVYAKTDVEVSVIKKEDFDLFLAYATPEVKIMLDLMIKRLRETSNLVATLKLELQNSSKTINELKEQINKLDFPT